MQISHYLRIRTARYWAAALTIITLNTAALSGCGGGVNLFSKQDDIALGQQIQQEIAADPTHYPILNDPTLTQYVQGIVNNIVSSPNVKNKDFKYVVSIINDDKTVNAFSIPGGPMYVYTGLLKFVDNEATLAGILAHEITHADHRHATQQMTKQYGLEMVASIALGQNPGIASQIAASLAGNLAVLKFSRDDERDADVGSFNDLAQLSGQPWYPAAIKYFMQKAISQQKEKSSALANLFATHPPSEERLANVQALASKAGIPDTPPSSQLRSSEYLARTSKVR
jgi:predicted Zn-dependent protease